MKTRLTSLVCRVLSRRRAGHSGAPSAMLAVGCALTLAIACGQAEAVDLSWSGFGTLSYAQSNRDYAYQRFIDSNGTFKRDTVLGAQLDAQFSPHWSAAVQAQIAPSVKRDSAWAITPSLAFLAWRPNDNWLIRAGRFRAPLFMKSESGELGTSFDTVRLPTELYQMVPVKEFDGAYLSRFWAVGDSDVSMEAYHGQTKTSLRVSFGRDLPVLFDRSKVVATGVSVSLRGPSLAWRAALHRAQATTSNTGGYGVSFPRVDLAPGVGYWQVSNLLPGPGVPMVSKAELYVATVGLDADLGQGWRMSTELARVQQPDFPDTGANAYGGYVSVSRSVGRFTPYLTFSALRSDARQLRWYETLSQASLPGQVPGAASIVAAQQMAANGINAFDQRSLALGSSYQLTPDSKIKVEWLRTHIGVTSTLLDRALGAAAPRHTSIDVATVNYSFSF